MSKSQISFFNNTGLKTWEIIDVSEKYYELKFEVDETKTYEEWKTGIDEILKDSIKAHKVSDVEVGSFLSSGVDSSYLVSLAKPDKTYTVGYTNKKYSEIDNAKELCDKLGIKNTSKIITKEEYIKC